MILINKYILILQYKIFCQNNLVHKHFYTTCIPHIKQGKTISIKFLFVSVDLLATSGDITATWTSPIYPKLYSNDSTKNPLGRPITPEEDSWIGSFVNIGAMIGTLPFGFIAEKFGRKPALLCIAVPHFISYITMAFAKTVYLFYFGRFFGGVAVGGGYTLLPMYIAEISEDSHRGIYSVTLGIFWSFGNFLPYAVGPFVSIQYFNLLAACFPIIFIIIFSMIGTETPHFLVAEKRIEDAEKVLMLLRSATKKDVQRELTTMQEMIAKEEHGSLSDIITDKSLRKALIISLILILLQQLVGVGSALPFYLQPILDASDTKISSDIGSLVMGVSCLVFSLIVPFIIERFGRKSLTIFSSIGNGFFLLCLGIFFFLKDSTTYRTDSIFWLPLASLISSLFMYQIGLNVMPWTISSELFPNSVKQISATTVSFGCWFGMFFVTKYFNDMNNALGRSGTFWFYAAMSLVCAIFTLLFVPETRGKSLAEIQAMIRRRLSFVISTVEHTENNNKDQSEITTNI